MPCSSLHATASTPPGRAGGRGAWLWSHRAIPGQAAHLPSAQYLQVPSEPAEEVDGMGAPVGSMQCPDGDGGTCLKWRGRERTEGLNNCKGFWGQQIQA